MAPVIRRAASSALAMVVRLFGQNSWLLQKVAFLIFRKIRLGISSACRAPERPARVGIPLSRAIFQHVADRTVISCPILAGYAIGA